MRDDDEVCKKERRNENDNNGHDPVEIAGSRWLRRLLDREDLKRPEIVYNLWQFALRRGWIDGGDTEARRLWFFAVACYSVRKGRSAGRCFTDCIYHRRYNAPTNRDDQQAAEQIKRLLHGPALPRSEQQPCDPEIEMTCEADKRKREFIKLLANKKS